MTGPTTVVWQGRRGSVLLGPTEHRVARHLARITGHGQVRIRTVALAGDLGLERSEAYRILARLRVLGLFGIADDRGGNHGGRRIWRTSIEHDGPGLDPDRHRVAWSRIRGWALARIARIRRAIATTQGRRWDVPPAGGRGVELHARSSTPAARPGSPPGTGGDPPILEQLARHGLAPALLEAFTDPRRRRWHPG